MRSQVEYRFAEIPHAFVEKMICLDQHGNGFVIIYQPAVLYDNFFQVKGCGCRIRIRFFRTGIRNINIIICLAVFIYLYIYKSSVEIDFIYTYLMIKNQFLQVHTKPKFLSSQQGILLERSGAL